MIEKKKDRTSSGLKKLGLAALTVAGIIIKIALGDKKS